MLAQTAELLARAVKLFRRVLDEDWLGCLVAAILACANERSLQVIACSLERFREFVQTLSDRVRVSFGGHVGR